MFGRSNQKKDVQVGSVPFGAESMKEVPKGHKNVDPKDIEQCPIYQMQKEKTGKKEKKPKGGCPLMPSEGKRNPPLGPLEEFYDTQLVSMFGYMLDSRGIWALTFDAREVNKPPIHERRKVFDTYPIYLKHTLFHDEENTKKMRSADVAQRFLVFDKFREQGNKRLNKEEYDEAIKYFERALGCYRWLEYVPEPDTDDETAATVKPADGEESEPIPQENQEDDETIPINSEEERKTREEIEQYKKEQKMFRKQYRGLMKVYCDDNVKYVDPSQLPEECDRDMVASMLYGLYLNMGVCYMKMSHFNLARSILDDAAKINEKNSQLMYRRSQAIAYDKWATYKDLLKAKDYIERAIEMANYEKIFTQEPGILKLMGLTNAKEEYVNQAHYVVKRLREKKQWIEERVHTLFERAKEIEEIEKEMIEDGKTPFEDGVTNVQDEEDLQQNNPDEMKVQEDPRERLLRLCGPQLTAEHQEYEIVLEMMRKYYRIIEFYTEQKKSEQVNLAKRELQRMMETIQEMSFYMTVNFIEYEDDEVLKPLQQQYNIDLKSKKIIRRLCHLCRDRVSDIFGKGIFNFEVLDYAMKDYFKRKAQEEKQQSEAQEDLLDKPEKSWFKNYVFSTEFALSLIAFAMIAGIFYVATGRAQLLTSFIGKQ